MNRQLLLALQKRSNERLVELRTQVENPELRAEDLPAIQEEIDEINKQLQEVADALANLEDDGEGDEGEGSGEDDEGGSSGDEGSSGSGEGGEGRSGNPEGTGGVSSEQRQAAMIAIKSALSTRNAVSTKARNKEIRSAFANFVVGNISEMEARSLGIEINNGSVTVPVEIAKEVITYAQEENLLRKYGSYVQTDADVKYPVLVKKASANVSKTERAKSGKEIPETDIEFDSIDLDPAEFDALATITKKLLKRTGVKIEQIVIDELKKAYVRKEINYMFNGNDEGNENPGALAKKAVAYYETTPVDLNKEGWSQVLYSQLVKLKGQPVTEVLKKAMWIINRAALTVLEDMTDKQGRPLLHEAQDGVGYKLLGHPVDFTDAADGTDPTKPVFYFGDFKAFHIQEVSGGMELQKLIEKFSGTNKVGFQIYNLIDGQLIYSPFEPAVYRYEVGATKPGA
ncbi:phage major capsid protein [Bacillus cereus]|uniref:Phage major capsid protein n=2 Tax=Bacillus thuringiensis TaxID=1428 RepID=A0A643MEW9_BACTU|nr:MULTISPECIES: phage major capsid protein [Bacillus cereus group]MCU5010024.1 phage major capsid protein [Bacillus cereus]AHZ54021.1 major capsid protein [Bacillus thuringiensis serovar kurstaki str. YBT-1520]AIM29149.1 major capsid protein [Bacillus thuringiensis serovar kurstaki str. YBT-1520]KAB1358098.1 phage major capsid protein [Bacillus thuringiensis]KAB1358395.1 phage major capsid protein [Bacillus thuringiensis]